MMSITHIIMITRRPMMTTVIHVMTTAIYPITNTVCPIIATSSTRMSATYPSSLPTIL